MQEFPINYAAVVVAAIVKMALGALWYSPVLFLPRWMRLAGISQDQMKSAFPKAMAVDLIGSLVMAFVLVHAIHYADAHGVVQGAVVGFFNWLGFIALTTLSPTIYEHRPLSFYAINSGYQLVALLLMGALLATWS